MEHCLFFSVLAIVISQGLIEMDVFVILESSFLKSNIQATEKGWATEAQMEVSVSLFSLLAFILPLGPAVLGSSVGCVSDWC